jgi:demethylspheroidene O-methyltransferase
MVGNAALAAMVEHHAVLYADLADPVALLRAPAGQSALARYWPYASTATARPLTQDEVDPYSALMATSMPLVADEILDAYSLARHSCVLDVGGGEGAFAAAAAARWPHLKLKVFDLPAVAQRARRQLAARGLSDRIEVHEGNFLTGTLPTGADVISLVRVVHDHDDDHVLALMHAVRRALPPHGVLLLAEPMAGTPGAKAMGDAYFGIYLWAMGSGKPRSFDRLAELLAQAGFERPRCLRNLMPLQTRVLLVRPSAVADRVVPSND